MQKGKVHLDGVISSRQTHNPVLVVDHIVIIREVIFEEGEVDIRPKRFIHYPLVGHEEERATSAIKQQFWKIYVDWVDSL